MAKKVSRQMNIILAIILLVVAVISILPILESGITGFAPSDTAITNATVYQEIGCDFVIDKIVFLSVLQGQTNLSEQLAANNFWLLSNTGTVNITVNISVSAADWLWESTTGCGGATCVGENAWWQVKCNNTKSGICNVTYGNVRDAVTDESQLRGLEQDRAINNATFYTNITVPIGERAGEHIGTVVGTCQKAPP